ncbi:MAG: hypothetical protein KDE34_21600 [Anaerolineales bacterium]|nr:hypothetical protein [Anaerolineales bacterium]
MKDKLTTEKMAEAITQAKALQQQGVTPNGPTSPAETAAESSGDSSAQNHREITKDKPYDPFALSPGQTPAVRSREKDKGISL